MRTYIDREIPGKWQMAWFVDQGHRLRLECRKPECLGKRPVVESTGVGTKSVDRYGSGSFHSKEKTQKPGEQNDLDSKQQLEFVLGHFSACPWAQEQRSDSDKKGGFSVSPTSWTFCH